MSKAQSTANTRRKIFFINLLPIVLIALNLRAPIASIAPVVDSVREYYALNAALAGLLTSLPLLAFGLVSFVVSYFQPVRAMFVGLLCILLGEIVRCVGGSAELFIGTAIMGSGIAVANVLLPSLVKSKFPRQIPKIMGIYSLVLNFSAMLGVLLILPLMGLLPVPLALSSWAILAVAAIASYLPQMSNRRISRPKLKSTATGTLFTNVNAWQITLFMGITSTIAYSFFAWYPSFLISFGFSAHFASQMMILAYCILVPTAFFAPLMLGVLPSARRIYLIIFICGAYIVCFALLLTPSRCGWWSLSLCLLACLWEGCLGSRCSLSLQKVPISKPPPNSPLWHKAWAISSPRYLLWLLAKSMIIFIALPTRLWGCLAWRFC